MTAPDVAEAGLLTEAALLDLASRALQAQGLARGDAEAAAGVLVSADLFGISTHGVDRIPSYSERLRIGGINPRPNITPQRVAPSVVRLNGDNGLGPLIGTRALETALDVARETGLAMVFVRGSNHFGPIIPYAYKAANAGFATMIASNATTTIAPSGGRAARLGNNPLGMGIPNPGGDPLILDMAISVVARAKIRRAADRGESIPETWATDGEGRPTSDPKAALAGFLSPIGGYKGYGLALMVDLFAGLLSGASYLTHVSSWVDTPEAPQDLGHFFLAVDTARLGPERWLGEAVADFAGILKDTPPLDAARPVLLPGEMEMRRFHEQQRNGIRVPPALVAKLEHLARGA